MVLHHPARDCTTGMETHETKETLACTQNTIASLEQFGTYTVTGGELIRALQSTELSGRKPAVKRQEARERSFP